MTLPRVCHITDNIEDAIYVGRANGRKRLKASPFANPFKVSDFGSRSECVTHYMHWLRMQPDLMAQLPELRNAPALACWCRRDGEERTEKTWCHADVIVMTLERYSDDELRGIAG